MGGKRISSESFSARKTGFRDIGSEGKKREKEGRS